MMGETDAVLAEYRRMVAFGTAPKLAEIFASRRAPGADTDATHYKELVPLHVAYGKEYAETTYAQAKAAGITVSDNCHYNASMADERCGGDPNAWVRVGEGRSEVIRRIREKGASCPDLGVVKNDRLIENELKREAKINKRKQRRMELAQKG